MDATAARRIADSLTWGRILSAFPITILAIYDYRWSVFVIYIAVALTDAIDGWFARRATDASYGPELDGKADVTFTVMSLIWIAILFPDFWRVYWFPYLPAFVMLQSYLLIARVRHKPLSVPHLLLGRISMVVFCFLLPVLVVFGDLPWFVIPVLALSVLAKAELVACIATGRNQSDSRSIFG